MFCLLECCYYPDRVHYIVTHFVWVCNVMLLYSSNSMCACRSLHNGPLPISRVAPLDQLLPLSLGSSGWNSNTCPMKIVMIFYQIIARCGRDFDTLTRSFSNQQWYNKSTYDLVERLLFPLLSEHVFFCCVFYVFYPQSVLDRWEYWYMLFYYHWYSGLLNY